MNMYEVVKPLLSIERFNKSRIISAMKHVIRTSLDICIMLKNRDVNIELSNNNEEKKTSLKFTRGDKMYYISIIDGVISKKTLDVNISNSLKINVRINNGILIINTMSKITEYKHVTTYFESNNDYTLTSELMIRTDRISFTCGDGYYRVILKNIVHLTHEYQGVKIFYQLKNEDDLQKIDLPKRRDFIVEIIRLIENTKILID